MMEALHPLSNFILLIVAITFMLAAFLDFIYYRLPNKLFYIIFYLFPLYILLSFKFHLFSNYLIFVGAILIGFGLFSATIIGGGDAKLLAAVTLWVGWDNLILFLIWMLIFGGMIAVTFLVFPRLISSTTSGLRNFILHQSLLRRSTHFLVPDLNSIEEEVLSLQKQRMIPYGISIAGAGLIILLKGMI